MSQKPNFLSKPSGNGELGWIRRQMHPQCVYIYRYIHVYTSASTYYIHYILLRCWWVSQHICDKSKKILKFPRRINLSLVLYIHLFRPAVFPRISWFCRGFPGSRTIYTKCSSCDWKKWWAYYGKRALAKRNVVFFRPCWNSISYWNLLKHPIIFQSPC